MHRRGYRHRSAARSPRPAAAASPSRRRSAAASRPGAPPQRCHRHHDGGGDEHGAGAVLRARCLAEDQRGRKAQRRANGRQHRRLQAADPGSENDQRTQKPGGTGAPAARADALSHETRRQRGGEDRRGEEQDRRGRQRQLGNGIEACVQRDRDQAKPPCQMQRGQSVKATAPIRPRCGAPSGSAG